MVTTPILLALFSSLATSVPVLVTPNANPLNLKPGVQTLGHTTSNLPNIYRDGGGGGRINGKDFLIFSDGIYTTDGRVPADTSLGNWANFSSNSIACSNCDGRGVTSLQDFGTQQRGPNQQIPYFYGSGEDDQNTAVWPNQGIATLCEGICGVSFPVVVNRTEIEAGRNGDLYNTSIQITVTGYGPAVRRPTQGLFRRGEPLFGSFGTLVGIDGYLYMFATITKTPKGRNGLKMARVPQGSWSDRRKYQFWSGSAWTDVMPAYDDGGKANIFNWSEDEFGTQYGPGTGDLFFSQYYGRYLLLFMSDAPALDPNGKLILPNSSEI